MRTIGLLAIKTYRRFISPYKGFSCAYRAYTGQPSCSALGYRAVRRYGVLRGMVVLDGRFARCAAAYERSRLSRRAFGSQRGDCDLPCAIDIFDCAPSPCDFCDWPRSRKKSRDAKEAAYLPPEKPPDRKKRQGNVSAM
jgi:putative component of membrane protein insertase Oxa1/YidC/SpoIIIJ protein YidD